MDCVLTSISFGVSLRCAFNDHVGELQDMDDLKLYCNYKDTKLKNGF